MQKFLLFVVASVIDFVRYGCVLAGVACLIAAIVLAFSHSPQAINPLLVLAVACGVLAVGLVITYFAAGKDSKKTGLALLEDLFITLLPPW